MLSEMTEQTENYPRVILLFFLRSIVVLIAMRITVSAQGDPKTYGDVTVKIEAVTSGFTTGIMPTGYEEYRATITHNFLTKPHQVTLIGQNEGSISGGPRYFEFKRTVDVAPGGTATISLLKPPLSQNGIIFTILIDGARQEESMYVDGGRAGVWVRQSINRLFILTSGRVGESGLMNEPAAFSGLKDSTGNLDVAYLSYGFPPNEWSANWLGYTGLDGVIVTAEELRAMPHGVLSALQYYLECGGAIHVIGPWEIPVQWSARGEVVNGLMTYYVGFGVLTSTGSMARINTDQWKSIKLFWEGSRAETAEAMATTFRDLADINKEFEVVDRVGIPVRGLFILMIAFVIVIGPVNLIWLARRRKKIWMLWTVPMVSLITCLAVTAFALLSEGVSAISRIEALTILDEMSHRATTLGWTAYYSPFTPSEGLHFSYDTELMPQIPVKMLYRPGRGNGRGVDWTNDQHLTTEWLTARIPAYFKLRKSETRRERLTLSETGDGAPSIVNGLGADIRQLWWADSSGNIYTTTNVPAGAQGSLTPINIRAAGPKNFLRSLSSSTNWLDEFDKLEKSPSVSLRANCYLAVIEASPFVEEGLRGARVKKVRTLVYGIRHAG